ncbi:MAG: OmpA family protein [Bacteroidota bacterium]
MNFKSLICFVLFIILCASVSAQKDFSKDANAAFDRGEYFSAIMLYKKAYSKERNNVVKTKIIFKTAECYRLINDTKQAEIWYKKSVKVKYQDPIAVLYLADAEKANGKYDEAIIEYNNYNKLVPNDPRGTDGIKSCELAQEWIDNPTRYEVSNAVLINSTAADFCPFYVKRDYKELIFTSSRDGATGKEIDGTTGQNFTDMWETKVDRKGKWSTPVLLDDLLNSDDNEGAATLDNKFGMIFFTRCPVIKDKKTGCQIFTSNKKGNNWEKPQSIPLAADSVTVGHPTLKSEGRKLDDDSQLFFASDLEGGYGGRDIWVSNFSKKKNEWLPPVNLGPDINTSGDEMFPYISEDGNLYFSSNGHIGLGGLDLFKATLDGNNWGNVTNLQYPLNSEGDDFGIIFEGKADRGFFTSDRKGGKGSDDIYFFVSPQLAFTLQGVVIDAETRTVLAGAEITLVGDDNTYIKEPTDEVGSYFFQLTPSTNYEVSVSLPKYLSEIGKETTVGLEESKDLIHDFELQSMKKPIELPNILYDLDRWELRPESKIALDRLVQTLFDNETIVIKIMSHTDSRAEDKYNLDLSQKRAQSVVDYLISKGVEEDRLEAQGYGEKKLLISDFKIKKMNTEEEKEAAHQKNRRTEFEVLRTDYVPTFKKGIYIEVPPPDLKEE